MALTYQRTRLAFLCSRRLLAGSAATTVAAFAVAHSLLPIRGAFAFAAVLALGVAVALAEAEPRRTRVVSLNLFMIGFAARAIALASFSWAALREGGPFLGPDSTGYLAGATDLAARGFHLGALPATFFGTYDASHYYLFAAAIRYLHADLFALQMLNAGLTALAAPLTFSIARRVLPRGARAAGLIVAVYPSLIVLSVVDLLKDPSLVFATLLAIWVVLSLARVRRPSSVAGLFVPGVVALLYLRTGRFYTFAYIEAAVACAAAWTFVRGRRAPFRTRTAVAGLLLMFAAAEVLPAAVGWATSPVLFASQVMRAAGTPALLTYSTGLADRLHAPAKNNEAAGGNDAQIPGSRVLTFASNLGRRALGPFPWIGPPQWTFRTLQAGDYLLYPGMLVWYAILPLTVLGCSLVARDLLAAAEPRFALLFLWLFTVVYFPAVFRHQRLVPPTRGDVPGAGPVRVAGARSGRALAQGRELVCCLLGGVSTAGSSASDRASTDECMIGSQQKENPLCRCRGQSFYVTCNPGMRVRSRSRTNGGTTTRR